MSRCLFIPILYHLEVKEDRKTNLFRLNEFQLPAWHPTVSIRDSAVWHLPPSHNILNKPLWSKEIKIKTLYVKCEVFSAMIWRCKAYGTCRYVVRRAVPEVLKVCSTWNFRINQYKNKVTLLGLLAPGDENAVFLLSDRKFTASNSGNLHFQVSY